MTLVLLLLVILLTSALVGGAGRAFVLHRRLVRDPAVFPCEIRVVRGVVPTLPRRARAYYGQAAWAHDVLVLHRGRGLGWAQPLAVRLAEDVLEPAGAEARARLGTGAVRLQLRLDDDSVVAVTVPSCAAELVAGPFLAIAASGLPGVSGRQGP